MNVEFSRAVNIPSPDQLTMKRIKVNQVNIRWDDGRISIEWDAFSGSKSDESPDGILVGAHRSSNVAIATWQKDFPTEYSFETFTRRRAIHYLEINGDIPTGGTIS
jgi:hypothetical protein